MQREKVVSEFTLEEAECVWLESDTHFDHTNIIRYCNRPFVTTREMNEYILHNWRRTIAPNDLVYFLGDLAFGRDSRKPRWWVTQLSGKIIWIKGSHDHGIHPTSILPNVERVVECEVVSCDGIMFFLVHDVIDAVGWKDGWVIHGHNHDNQPHINFVKKRVNVSVEVINYTPISLASIVREIKEGKNHGDEKIYH